MAKVQKLRARKKGVILNRSAGGDFGITVFLVILGIFMFIPMYFAIVNSLKPLDELFLFPPRLYVVNPSLQNFADLFRFLGTSWVPFSRYLFNTIFISVMGTGGNLLLGSMAAYAFSKIKFPGSKAMFWLITRSLMIHAVATAHIIFIILAFAGLIDSFWAVIIPAWGGVLGIFLMKNYIDQNVSDAVLEAARIDGAKEFRIFSQIVMPMAKPALYTAIMFSFQGLWNMGATVVIYSEQLKTLNYAIQQIIALGPLRAGAGAAASVFMMAVPVAVFVITQAKIIETMASSGMKD